jgi:hypothetical protein
MMPRFLVTIHDASPAFASETRTMLRDLAPLLGRRLSFGVVPDWHGAWPLAKHAAYCRLVQESAEELLLHGYFHRRARGRGPTSLLTDGCDEMNGLDRGETRRTLERGQRVFAEVFGERARGFLAPGWRRGHVRAHDAPAGMRHVLGFFSLDASSGTRVPLATWTWDVSRWRWTGLVGHGIGRLLHSVRVGVPTLAIHPTDLHRGHWPRILRLVETLLAAGCAPSTPARLLEAHGTRVAA